MLSFKVTYALQILDLLQKHKDGINILDLRKSFPFLPVETIITDIVHRLNTVCLIAKPGSRDNRYRINVSLSDLTLYDLSQFMDGAPVLGNPVGFRYWSYGYLDSRPYISDIEQQLRDQIIDTMKSVTVAELLKEQIYTQQHSEIARQPLIHINH